MGDLEIGDAAELAGTDDGATGVGRSARFDRGRGTADLRRGPGHGTAEADGCGRLASGETEIGGYGRADSGSETARLLREYLHGRVVRRGRMRGLLLLLGVRVRMLRG